VLANNYQYHKYDDFLLVLFFIRVNLRVFAKVAVYLLYNASQCIIVTIKKCKCGLVVVTQWYTLSTSLEKLGVRSTVTE